MQNPRTLQALLLVVNCETQTQSVPMQTGVLISSLERNLNVIVLFLISSLIVLFCASGEGGVHAIQFSKPYDAIS